MEEEFPLGAEEGIFEFPLGAEEVLLEAAANAANEAADEADVDGVVDGLMPQVGTGKRTRQRFLYFP